MRKLLIERGPAVGVWLFSMAAQLSGYNNAAIALFLLGLAMFFLVAPAGYHLQARRKEQGLPILSTIQTVTLVGIGGTWLFLTVTLASVGWSIWHGEGLSGGAAAIQKQDEGPLVWF